LCSFPDNTGFCVLQISWANWHLGWKGQPEGGFIGLGGSPSSLRLHKNFVSNSEKIPRLFYQIITRKINYLEILPEKDF